MMQFSVRDRDNTSCAYMVKVNNVENKIIFKVQNI